jgi:serine protease AprX
MFRLAALAVLIAAISLVPSVAARAPAASASDSGRVDRALQSMAQQQPGSSVRVIVQTRRGQDAVSALQRLGGTPGKLLPHVAAVASQIRAGQVHALAQQPGVLRVMLDQPMRLVQDRHQIAPNAQYPDSVFPPSVGASTLWSNGLSGRGVAIAVLDSGIQPHLDFDWPSRIVAARRFNDRASSAADQLGHGTWVASIAAGSGAAFHGRYRGMAPGASIVNLKVSDDTGAAYASDVVEALGWIARNHAAFNIRVANLSFVSSVDEGYATSLLAAAVEMVWHAGVVVVVSAGNRGADMLRFPPANDPYVITVGASDDMGSAWPGDDTLAWFSSFGLTQDGISKPDLVAPGRHIVGSLASSGAVLALEFPSKRVGQRYIQLSGTSAAAPVVAGGIGLLLQAYPRLTPDQVKWLLVRSARPLADDPPGAGAGELSLSAASGLATGDVGRANLGLVPNNLVGLAYLAHQGQPGASWDSVSWDSVSWDSVSWDSVSWDSVSWDSVSWDSVSGGAVSWDSVIGDD